MICVGLSDILYPGGTSAKIHVSCARFYRCCTRLRSHSTRITFIFIILINRFVPPSRPQCTLRRESQQRSNVIGLVKVYSVCTSNLASHRVVVCAERNRVFSTCHHHHRCHCCSCCCCCHHALRQRFQARRGVDVSVKSRVSKIHLYLALHMNFREL